MWTELLNALYLLENLVLFNVRYLHMGNFVFGQDKSIWKFRSSSTTYTKISKLTSLEVILWNIPWSDIMKYPLKWLNLRKIVERFSFIIWSIIKQLYDTPATLLSIALFSLLLCSLTTTFLRLSIQTLCDEAGTSGVIDDNSDYLHNFCNIIENLLCHRYHGKQFVIEFSC